jgi:hypothetical protein
MTNPTSTYDFRDLGDPAIVGNNFPGALAWDARDINAAADSVVQFQVAGMVSFGVESHAVLWEFYQCKPPIAIDLSIGLDTDDSTGDTLPGEANALNNNLPSWVAGWHSHDGGNTKAAVVWGALGIREEGCNVVADGPFSNELQMPDGTTASEALDINNSDMVVGWLQTAAGERHAFLNVLFPVLFAGFPNGITFDLSDLGGSGPAVANAISEADFTQNPDGSQTWQVMVVGNVLQPSGTSVGVKWMCTFTVAQPSTFNLSVATPVLPVVPDPNNPGAGLESAANDVTSGQDVIVVQVTDPEVHRRDAWYWDQTGLLPITNVLEPPDIAPQLPLGINDTGVIVGTCATTLPIVGGFHFHAWVQANRDPADGTPGQDLNSLLANSLPDPNYVLSRANKINNEGSIVGNGLNGANQVRAWVLTVHP